MTLFEALIKDGEAAILDLVANGVPERVDLEFKQKANAAHGDFEKTDKQNLGKLLSAFANSAGGVLVFGVVASDVDGIDCAKAVAPIAEIAKFASQARTLVGQYMIPPFEGVRVEALPCADGSGRGYLAIEVLRSESRPHQSDAPGDGHFYKRAGDSTFRMARYDIEDAFRRQASPSLSLHYSLRSGPTTSGHNGRTGSALIRLQVAVANAAAQAPFVHLVGLMNASPVLAVSAAMQGPSTLRSSPSGEYRFDGQAGDVFHPGVTYDVAQLVAELRQGLQDTAARLGDASARSSLVAIDYRLGALGMRVVTGRLEVPGPELLAAVGMS